MLADADGNFADVTYKIKRDKNKSGKMKLNYFSAIPVQPNFIPASNVHVIHYGQPNQVVIQQQQTIGTTHTTTIHEGIGVGANVNVDGVGIGVNVNISDPIGTSVTQTTTTTTINSDGTDAQNQQQVSNRGCTRRNAISQSNFSNALASVKNQGFDETRLKVAKQIASANCLNVNQIIQISKIGRAHV